jgi:hypothetical protein
MEMKPKVYDLFCGLGGWAEGFLAEGYECIGFDIEAHDYGTGGYPGTLILRDIRSIHGSELKDATCIVASPPCQAYSYRAMPWKRAKALPPPDNTLFNECFRIQREANAAVCHCECWRCARGGHCVRCDAQYNTGKPARYIPMVIENVRGAQKWVGRAQWNYGSFYLWGDVPALMPFTLKRHSKIESAHLRLNDPSRANVQRLMATVPKLRPARAGYEGQKVPGFRFDGSGKSKSSARKAASAMIAKIPEPLARHIARAFYPRDAHAD